MTGLASLPEMSAFQGVSCFRMIKGYFTPFFTIVTTHTIWFRIIFGIEDQLMDVLMAVVTSYPYLPETPSVFLFMTDKTGGCQVSTGQFKGTFIMHFNGKTG
jgi:hypothetical protein